MQSEVCVSPLLGVRVPFKHQLEVCWPRVLLAECEGLVNGFHVQRVVQRRVQVRAGGQTCLSHSHAEQRDLVAEGAN